MRFTDKTVYRMAEDIEIPLCSYLVGDRKDIANPVVVAVRDGEIIGFISTRERRDIIEAGAFFAKSPIVALRLVQAYENFLKRCNIHEYHFAVETGNQHFCELIHKFMERVPNAIRQYAVGQGFTAYRRMI